MGIFSEQIALLVKADTDGAVKPLANLEKQSGKTDKAFTGMAKNAQVSTDVLNRGLAQLKDFAIGAGIAATLTKITTGFVDAANAANVLSQTTNSTIEQSSKFLAVASQYGLELNDVVEIFADFQQSAAASGDELERLGVAIAKNADGTTDWITTSVNFLESLDGISDATERNRLLFKFFGEEGAKQLIALTNSGISLADAMEQVTGLDPADVRTAQEYNVAMRDLKSSATDLSMTLGSTLAGAATTLARAVEPVAKVIGALDGATLLLGAAAFGLSRYWDDLVGIGRALGSGLANLGNAVLKPLTVDFGDLGLSAERAGDKVEKANKKVSPKALGTGAILAAAAAWEVASSAASAYNSTVEQIAGTTADVSLLTDEDLRKVQDSLSLWEKFGQAVRSAFTWEGLKQTLLGPFFDDNDSELTQLEKDLRKAEEAQRDLAEVQGATAVAALEQKDAQQALSDVLYEGTFSQQELTDAVNAAGEAQADQNRVTEESKGLMDAYAASTYAAADATLALFDKQFAARDAQRRYNEGLEEGLAIIKKGKTGSDEYGAALDGVQQDALRVAAATADAARQQDQLNGIYRDSSYYVGVQIEELKRLADAPGIPESVRDAMYTNLINPLIEAQTTAAGGIVIDGITFKEGTTEDQVNKLKADIDAAFARGDVNLAVSLQKQLEGLKVGADVQVNITGPDGKPMPADGVTVPVTVTGQDEAGTVIDNLAAKKREAVITPVVRGWFAADALLDSLATTRTVTYNVVVSGIGAAEIAANQDLNGNGVIGRAALRPYRAMAYVGAEGPARAGGGSQYAIYAGGELAPRKREETQVNVYLDSKQIASYLQPGGSATEPRTRRP